MKEEKLKVRIKKLSEDSIIPSYAKSGDAGLDFTATSVSYDTEFACLVYGTGIKVEIPEGYVGLLFPRSSIANERLVLTNSVGVIDSGYRGEIKFKFKTDTDFWSSPLDENKEQIDSLESGIFETYLHSVDEFRDIRTDLKIYKIGDRIGQMIILPYPKIEFEEVEELSDSERGEGGYGSSN